MYVYEIKWISLHLKGYLHFIQYTCKHIWVLSISVYTMYTEVEFYNHYKVIWWYLRYCLEKSKHKVLLPKTVEVILNLISGKILLGLIFTYDSFIGKSICSNFKQSRAILDTIRISLWQILWTCVFFHRSLSFINNNLLWRTVCFTEFDIKSDIRNVASII